MRKKFTSHLDKALLSFIKQEDTINSCHLDKTLLFFIRHTHFSVICACAMKSILQLKADHSKGLYHLGAKQAANYMLHNHKLQTLPCWSMDSFWPQISWQMISQLDHRSPCLEPSTGNFAQGFSHRSLEVFQANPLVPRACLIIDAVFPNRSI